MTLGECNVPVQNGKIAFGHIAISFKSYELFLTPCYAFISRGGSNPVISNVHDARNNHPIHLFASMRQLKISKEYRLVLPFPGFVSSLNCCFHCFVVAFAFAAALVVMGTCRYLSY